MLRGLLAELVKADRAAATALPVLDRLLTPAFRAEHPDRAFLFQQMGTFNTAKMADLRAALHVLGDARAVQRRPRPLPGRRLRVRGSPGLISPARAARGRLLR